MENQNALLLNLNFPWYVEEYFNNKKLSEKTKEIYKLGFITFFEWLSDQKLCNSIISKITLGELDKLTLKNFLSYKYYLEIQYVNPINNTIGLSPASVASKLSSISSLFHYLAHFAEHPDGTAYIRRNWLSSIKKNDSERNDYKRAKILKDEILVSIDELNEFREFVINIYGTKLNNRQLSRYKSNKERDAAIISLLMFSGIRLNELVELKLNDIDIHNNYLLIYSKNGNERKVTLNKETKIDLNNYLLIREQLDTTSKYVFLTKHKNSYSNISDRSVQIIVNKYSEAFGKEGLTPQKLRHSFATVFFIETTNLAALHRELGQERINPICLYKEVYRNKENKLY